MKRSFLIGTILTVFVVFISLITNDWNFIFKISGIAGLVALLLSGMFLGAFVGGDQTRANFHTEDETSREKRTRYAFNLVAFSVPNIAAAAIILFLANK